MENCKKEEKKKFWKGLLIGVGLCGLAYEVLARKGKVFQNAWNWTKGKIQSRKQATQVEGGQPQQGRQNNGGDWKQRRNN